MTGIIGMRRLDDTIHRMGGEGDNWYTTWAANDKLYTSMTDGTGFPDVEGYTGMSHNTSACPTISRRPTLRRAPNG